MVSHRRLLLGFLVGVGVGTLAAEAAWADAFVPLLLKSEVREGIPLPATVAVTARPTREPLPTATPCTTPAAPTQTLPATSSPTAQEPGGTPTESPSPVATPTRRPAQGRIHGRCTVRGKPLWQGYGVPPYPQLQLRRRAGGVWETVARAATDAEGRFVFANPPILEPGEVYQVWWVNEDSEESSGDWTLLGRWWSRLIAQFGDGDDVDVGVFELADLEYVAPCNDCHQTPPITYRWRVRDHPSEVYRWALHRHCNSFEDQWQRSFRTESLGRQDNYTTGPPPGFTVDRTYCWYVFIEDGTNGSGWPYFEWRTRYLGGSAGHGCWPSVWWQRWLGAWCWLD